MKFKNGIAIAKTLVQSRRTLKMKRNYGKVGNTIKKKESVAIDGQPSLSGKSVEGRRRNSEI